MKVPPPTAARKNTATTASTQLAIVRHGCLALAIATARVSRFMVVPLGVVAGAGG